MNLKLTFHKIIQIAYVTVQNRGAQVSTHSKRPRVLFYSNLDITQNAQVQSKVAHLFPWHSPWLAFGKMLLLILRDGTIKKKKKIKKRFSKACLKKPKGS